MSHEEHGSEHPFAPAGRDAPPAQRPRSTKLHDGLAGTDPFEDPSQAGQRFSIDTLMRDAPAGIITGLMAIPLTVGICLLSEYPIQIGLATVVVACVVGFVASLFRPGNYIGVPGVAAGLAPVLALGVHRYGLENMPWIIFLTAASQMVVWKFRLEAYILKAVPAYLIEGLLAGVGLKIAMKFVPYTYETVGHSDVFWNPERIRVVAWSAAGLLLFLFLYKKFKDRSPGVPYIVVIAGSIWLATEVQFPMLHLEPVTFAWVSPFPDFAAIPLAVHVEMVLFAMMLSAVDIIEQVMSNAAIEKIDPLGRKADSNNSLLAIWLANGISSFFGGMTNLDGLAKSSTNRMAGAVTKMSCLFVAAVLGGVVVYPHVLTYLPEFSLAVLMIFTGWKMIAGMAHVAHHGKYAFALAMLCGILVFRLGIFEGLLISLALHSFIVYIVYRAEQLPTVEILRKFLEVFTEKKKNHPHQSDTLDVVEDAGGVRYVSAGRPSIVHRTLDDFIDDWEHAVDSHNVLRVVSAYDGAGLLWDTSAQDRRVGHAHIKRYFDRLFELDDVQLKFDSAETRQYRDIYIRSGSYTFSYRKRGAQVQVPARYALVCKREKMGWYILEHHSSEFPS